MKNSRKLWAPNVRCYNNGFIDFHAGIKLKNDPYDPHSRKRDVNTHMRRAFSSYWSMGWHDAKSGASKGTALKHMRER